MTAKTILVTASTFVALGISPVLAGPGCGGANHAYTPEIIADAEKSAPAEAETYTSIPYPLPTLDEDTQTAAVDDDTETTTE